MLVSIFYYILGTFIALLQALLSAIIFWVPDRVRASLVFVTNYFGMFSPIVNWAGVLPAFSWYLIGIAAWFTFLMLMWVWHKIPWVGKQSMEVNYSGSGKKR
jgi:hypothetical protein